MNTATLATNFDALTLDQLDTISGGGLFGLHAPKWVDNTVHAVGSAVKKGAATVFNPKAIEHGVIWGGAGAAASSETGPGALAGGAIGFAAGYLDSQLSQHGG